MLSVVQKRGELLAAFCAKLPLIEKYRSSSSQQHNWPINFLLAAAPSLLVAASSRGFNRAHGSSQPRSPHSSSRAEDEKEMGAAAEWEQRRATSPLASSRPFQSQPTTTTDTGRESVAGAGLLLLLSYTTLETTSLHAPPIEDFNRPGPGPVITLEPVFQQPLSCPKDSRLSFLRPPKISHGSP